MSRILITLSLALPLGVLACKSQSQDMSDTSAEVVLCDCGMEKGTEGCCDADAEHCPDCGKIKGSPGCCK